MSKTYKHYRSCNICEAMCGLEIEHTETQVISIKGDNNDPFSQGYMCPKATALQDFYEDPDRLKTPMKKCESGWQAISWQQAFDEITQNLTSIQQRDSKDALAVYLGNPNAHNLGNALMLKPFMKALGTRNRFSSASADQLPHHVASSQMLGAGMLIPIPDIDRTQFMLIIGGNPVVSNGSMMTAPNVIGRIKAIQKRGGKVVVVDPKRTKTAKIADQHLFINPEKDALLLLSMIHCVFEQHSINLNHLSEHVHGIEQLEQLIADYSPVQVAPIVGISADEIMQLVREMVHAESAVCYSRMGASTQQFGGLCQWLTNVFNIITGNFDSVGGAMFTQPAFDLLRNYKRGYQPATPEIKSRVSQYPFFNNEFPVACLAEEILTPGEGQLKGLITIAGNPVLSAPNGKQLATAFESLDYMVSIDIYINETTKYADIILPATTGLENSNYDIFFNSFSVRNTAKYSPILFQPSDEQYADWQILAELAARMTNTSVTPYTPEMILDAELKAGRYGEQGLSLQQLKDNPHGIDLGPLQPCLLERIKTADGKINLCPTLFLQDLPRLKRCMETDQKNSEFPLSLISRRLVKSHNTWTQNSARLVKGKNPCTLEINPKDAKSLSIKNGQQVKVNSASGEIIIDAVLTNDIKEGVVSMPQGWGHNQDDTQMSVAATQPGVSINDITQSDRTDLCTGNAALNGTSVSVRPV